MTRQASERSRAPLDLKRIVDIMVFAPIGLGTAILEDGPEAVRRAQQELRNARFMGRIAVDRGVAELRRRIDDAPTPTSPVVADAEPVTNRATLPPADDASDLDPDGLALPDYDTLPAIDIVDKLEHLSATERSAIREYEQAHRRRRTVLGKLAQLAEA